MDPQQHTKERWRKLEALFYTARQLSGQDRVAFLDEQCRGNSELRTELESLTEADESFPEFLRAPGLSFIAYLRKKGIFEEL